MSNDKTILKQLGRSLLAVLMGLFVGALAILASRHDPFEVYGIMIKSSFGSWTNVGHTLFSATPLIMTGLAVAFSFRVGLFNVGVEGQLYLGAYVASWVGYALGGLPRFIHLPLTVVSAALAGGTWAAIPGYIRARRGSNEVVTTIMMNFLASALVSYLVGNVFRHPTRAMRTPDIAPTAHLTRLTDMRDILGWDVPYGLQLNSATLIALVLAVLMYIVIWRTPWGFRIRAVGLNQEAALAKGINVPRIITVSMAVSGAIAGMSGLNDVLGYNRFFMQGFSPGYGFTGIAVALLGRNHPVGVVAAGLFFGALNRGALMVAVMTSVPQDLIKVMQSVIVFFMGCETGLELWAAHRKSMARGSSET